MKRVIFTCGGIVFLLSILSIAGIPQNTPKYTGKWVESFTCGCGAPLCLYKLIMFDGSTVDCDEINIYNSGNHQLEVCVRKGKVVYQSKWIHDYRCFEWEEVGKDYGVKNGGERFGGEKSKGDLPEPGIYIDGKKVK